MIGSIGGLLANTRRLRRFQGRRPPGAQPRRRMGPKTCASTRSPGLVKTDFARALGRPARAERIQATPLRRLGEPRDIGGIAVLRLRRRRFHHRPVHRRRRRRYHSVAMDLNYSPEELRSEEVVLAEANLPPDLAEKVASYAHFLEGRPAALAQDPGQAGLGRSGVAQGMRHGLERGATLYPRGRARLGRCAAAHSVRSRHVRAGPASFRYRGAEKALPSADLPRRGSGLLRPGSGSDLASLKTKAQRAGEHYVVNGQKTWTTLAHYADWIFWCAPIRTSSGARKASRSFSST